MEELGVSAEDSWKSDSPSGGLSTYLEMFNFISVHFTFCVLYLFVCLLSTPLLRWNLLALSSVVAECDPASMQTC